MLDMAEAQPQVERMADYLAGQAGLKTVVNFTGMPLSRDQRAGIVKLIGAEIREIHHPARVDVTQPVRPQVAEIMNRLIDRMRLQHAPRIDYIVPASHSVVAHLIAGAIVAAGDVGVILLRRANGGAVVVGGVE